MTNQVSIVDYGMGNLRSVANAFSYLGTTPVITDKPKKVLTADALVLPGVGSFFLAMKTLQDRGLAEALREAVLFRKRKILGICLGMQLMAEHGTEDGECPGLDFLPGTVKRFTPKELGRCKAPHIGFNRVNVVQDSRMFTDITLGADFYFVHSYHLPATKIPGEIGICRHGINFTAAYERENVFATQFHPEKSQTNGLILLRNFLNA